MKTWKISYDELRGEYRAEPTSGEKHGPSSFLPDGEYVPAEVAERLYEAIAVLTTTLNTQDQEWIDKAVSVARDALKFADEYGGGSDERS